MYIQRTIEKLLPGILATFPCLAVTGPRQSGKSTLLRHALPEYRYVTLDDPSVLEQAHSDPVYFLDSLGEQCIIDEIQLAPGILSYVKLRVDNDRGRNGRFVFTGSQQFGMIRNLGDSLAGRIALLDLLPFEARELQQAAPTLGGLGLFTTSCLTGAYPQLAVTPEIDRRLWYASYIQTYLERDIRSLYDIGSLREFHRFMQLLAVRCSQMLNMSSFATDLGVSVTTVKRWLSVLEAGRIIHLLPPHFNNLGKRITKMPKVYFLDTGLACHLVGIRDREQLLEGPMAGALFENYCLQETVKSFANRGEQPRISYLRTNNGLEVDLIIEGPNLRPLPVEIKLSRTPSQSLASSLSRYAHLFEKADPEDGLLLCLADGQKTISRGVTAIGVEDYLEMLRQRLDG
ncbi:MAG: ATP-binding protein [Desulfuromonadales bacterium]|nr:ATP-binding protein [Desulfuromonadales bacterium]